MHEYKIKKNKYIYNIYLNYNTYYPWINCVRDMFVKKGGHYLISIYVCVYQLYNLRCYSLWHNFIIFVS